MHREGTRWSKCGVSRARPISLKYEVAERTSSSTSSVTWSSPSWTATRTIASAAISTQNHAATRHASRCVFLSSMHLAHSPCHLSMRSSVCPSPHCPHVCMGSRLTSAADADVAPRHSRAPFRATCPRVRLLRRRAPPSPPASRVHSRHMSRTERAIARTAR